MPSWAAGCFVCQAAVGQSLLIRPLLTMSVLLQFRVVNCPISLRIVDWYLSSQPNYRLHVNAWMQQVLMTGNPSNRNPATQLGLRKLTDHREFQELFQSRVMSHMSTGWFQTQESDVYRQQIALLVMGPLRYCSNTFGVLLFFLTFHCRNDGCGHSGGGGEVVTEGHLTKPQALQVDPLWPKTPRWCWANEGPFQMAPSGWPQFDYRWGFDHHSGPQNNQSDVVECEMVM